MGELSRSGTGASGVAGFRVHVVVWEKPGGVGQEGDWDSGEGCRGSLRAWDADEDLGIQ